MSLEAYLYRSDAFRISTFKNPLPLPLNLEDPAPHLRLDGATFRSLVSHIISILQVHYIDENKSHLAMQMISKPGYPGGDLPVLTLVVEIDQGLSATSAWGKARDDLRALFVARGLGYVNIEMYDWDRAFIPSLHPLMPHDNAVQVYEARRTRLLECIHEGLGDCWNAMSLFGLGSISSAMKPALVVLVQPGTVRIWNTLLIKLRVILPNPDISIEFLPGDFSQTRGISLRDRLSTGPEMGSSIGVLGRPLGTGTMAGHILFKHRDGILRSGVLTNHHVVSDEIDMTNRYGYGHVSPAVTTIIGFPSTEDVDATKEALETEVALDHTAISEATAALERFEMKGEEPPTRQLDRLETHQKQLAQAEEMKTMLDNLPVTIGKVLFSSGNSINSTTKLIIDWAIVETTNSPASQNRNRLPSSRGTSLTGKLASFYGTGEPDYNVSDDAPQYARHFAEIEKGKWYFKAGRTTGLTTGICHGTEVEIVRKGAIRWDQDGNEVIQGPNSTSELIIMGKSRGDFAGNAESFSEPGDSGSFVINSLGEVAGLLYGELSSYGRYVRAGLVQSMDEVLASIRLKTGGDLSLP